MPLIKQGRLVEDVWTPVADDAPLPAAEAIVVSLGRWQQERAALIERNGRLGVRLANTDPVDALGEDLPRLALVAVHFPKFTDGRAYSQARLLRERYRFEGEIRATGQVLRDQLLFMQRCGIDAVELRDGESAAAWQAAMAEFSVVYQGTADGLSPAMALRRQRAAVSPRKVAR